MHCANRKGQKLPTFRDWVVEKHGMEYWKGQFEDVFEAYTSDIFREYISRYITSK